MAATTATEQETPSPPAVTPVVAEQQVAVIPVETEPAPVREPVVVETAAEADQLVTITDHGVGTAVENRQLVGRGRSVHRRARKCGSGPVCAAAHPGETIDHVWLREGVEATRVSLTLGGAHWRTHSGKMLWPDSAGDWAVEARDGEGRVLARREFVCVP